MHDVSQDSWLRQREVQDRLARLFGSYGYQFLEMPILEPTELFLRKSGGQMASQMYSFTDFGGNSVSLRPEFTAPTMRHYLEHSSEIALPARWQYAGPVFRYEPSGSGWLQDRGQFTQVGAELIGSDSVLADVELLSLASQVPVQLGVNGCWVELADLAVVHSLLDVVGLSDRARSFIIANISILREGRSGLSQLLDRARQIHLSGPVPDGDEMNIAIAGLDDRQAREVLKGFLRWRGGTSPPPAAHQVPTATFGSSEKNASAADGGHRQSSGPSRAEEAPEDVPSLIEDWGDFGQRRPDEIVDRLLRKLRGSDDWGKLTHGLELVAELVEIKGDPPAALDAARQVLHRAGAETAALDRLASVVELLSQGSNGRQQVEAINQEPSEMVGLRLDFSLARGLAYYNGIVFEVRHSDWPDSLGGGGRYDGLAKGLGSANDVPACGFAFTLEALLKLRNTPARADFSAQELPSALVVAEEAKGYRQAIDCVLGLREEGYAAELDVCGMALPEALDYARCRGLGRVVVVQLDGQCATYQVD